MRPQRFFGFTIVAGAILTIVGNAFHPMLPPLDVDAYANAAAGTVWTVAHVALLAGVLLLTLGFLEVYAILRRRGEGVYSMAGAFAVVLAAVLWSLVFVLDGFVGVQLAADYRGATGAVQDTLRALLAYHETVLVHLVVLALLLTGIGTGLFAGSLWVAKLYPRPLAATGIGVALALLGGYAAGIYGPYFVGNLLSTAVASALLVWALAVGVFVMRGPPGARPAAATA